MRPSSSPAIIWAKPRPSSVPSSASVGTRQSVRAISQLSTPLYPSLGRSRETVSPGTFSTSRMLIPRYAGSAAGSVLHSRATRPARRDDARQAGQDSAGHVVNGTKTWITNARRAGLVALLCKTDPAADPAYRGMSILLVEKVPGLTVSRDLPKLGYKGVESCEIALTDCRVPTDALLGTEEGSGFAQMMAGLELG